MGVKNENHSLKIDCLVYDRASGRYLRTTQEILDASQEELTKIAEQDGYVTYKEMLDIISKDWPEDVRNKFLGKATKPAGWITTNKAQNADLQLNKSTATTDDGKTIIRFELN